MNGHPETVEAQIKALKAALKRALEAADSERKRANMAEESARAAWRLSIWRRPTGLEAK